MTPPDHWQPPAIDAHVQRAATDDYQVALTLASGEVVIVGGPSDYDDVGLTDIEDVLDLLLAAHLPLDLIYQRLREAAPGWDAEAEVRRRSEADMAVWRQKDRQQRAQLREQFRRSRRPTEQPPEQR